MKFFRLKHSVFLLFILLTFLLPTISNAEEDATEAPSEEPFVKKGYGILAGDVFDLNLNFDTTMDIQGETRFFSSRHNNYVGGRMIAHVSSGAIDRTFFLSNFFGLVWGKSSFLMNWEEPGLISFDPLDCSITSFSIPFGMDANLNLGGIFKISPYVSAKLMFLRLNVEISDEDFNSLAGKIGFNAGVRATLKLYRWSVTAGVGLTHILNGEIEFELDDSVTFMSHTSGSSPEYFVGFEL